jgi:hypothetical protein
MFQQLRLKISGFKTYIVASSAGITLVVAWLHKDVSNAQAIRDGVALLLSATLRAAVAKAEPTSPLPSLPVIPAAKKTKGKQQPKGK